MFFEDIIVWGLHKPMCQLVWPKTRFTEKTNVQIYVSGYHLPKHCGFEMSNSKQLNNISRINENNNIWATLRSRTPTIKSFLENTCSQEWVVIIHALAQNPSNIKWENYSLFNNVNILYQAITPKILWFSHTQNVTAHLAKA